jgi:hypothetical protein
MTAHTGIEQTGLRTGSQPTADVDCREEHDGGREQRRETASRGPLSASSHREGDDTHEDKPASHGEVAA